MDSVDNRVPNSSSALVAAVALIQSQPRVATDAWLHDVGRVMVRGLVLVTGDLAALFTAALFAYLVWARAALNQPLAIYEDIAQLLLLMPVGYAAAGLYPGFGLGAVESLRRISYCTAAGFVVIAASTFLLKLPATQSRGTFFVAWLAASLLVPLYRYGILSVVRFWKGWAEPAILIGEGAWLDETISCIRQTRAIGFRPVGILSASPHFQSVSGIPVWTLTDAERALSSGGIGTAIVADTEEHLRYVRLFQAYFRHVVVLRTHMGMPLAGSRMLNLGGALGIEFQNNLLVWENRVIKRIIDLSVGSALLLIAAPLIVLAGIVIKLRSPGPALFVQEREGFKGKLLRIWKLRTMHVDAQHRLKELLEADPKKRDEWDRHMKLREDPRLIPGGRLLRRLSLDELPQLWNVIRGDMSLVGPRPFPEYHVHGFPSEFRELRRCVRPGLTGMWQVMSRSDGGLDEQQRYDTYYVQNWSLWLDLYLLFRTFVVVLSGQGAY